MAEVITYQRFWQRRDTAANWTSVNPELAPGEWGVELDNTGSFALAFKLGDGRHWNSTPYSNPAAFIASAVTNGDTTHAPSGDAVFDAIAVESAARTAAIAAAVAGLAWKQPVRVATTAAGTLASSFENGDTIDGVVLATGDRILIKNQAAPAENGVYVVAASGAPTRSTDADSGAELVNASCYVSEGTANADTQWTCTTNSPITVGSTALAFAQLSTGSFDLPGTIHAATGKTTPVDADEFGIVDSAASNVLKKLTWANVKATMWTAWGAQIAAGTGKTTPVNADSFAICDSAASNATKQLTFTNLKAFLKSYFDGIYSATATLATPVTWSWLDKDTTITVNNALLRLTGGTGTPQWRGCRCTKPLIGDGAWYWEIVFTAAGNNSMSGISTARLALNTTSFTGFTNYSYGYYGSTGQTYFNNVATAYGASLSAVSADVLGIAFRVVAGVGSIWFSKNGVWQGSGDPVAGTNAAYTGIASEAWFPTLSTNTSTTDCTLHPTTASLTYAAPTGYTSLSG